MPHCLVLQPNGRYAIWSTFVDDFVALDCTREEAIEEETSYDRGGYPGGPGALRKAIESEFEHIEESGIAWDWAHDWNDYVRMLKVFKNHATLNMIDEELGLPRRMKRTVSSLKQARYWLRYWRQKCERLENELREYKNNQG